MHHPGASRPLTSAGEQCVPSMWQPYKPGARGQGSPRTATPIQKVSLQISQLSAGGLLGQLYLHRVTKTAGMLGYWLPSISLLWRCRAIHAAFLLPAAQSHVSATRCAHSGHTEILRKHSESKEKKSEPAKEEEARQVYVERIGQGQWGRR
jgi:hypothetical protein